MVNRSKETPFSVHYRTLEEIVWYLKTMQGFPVEEIAVEATRAVAEWEKGNLEPGLTVLMRWYSTLRQGTDHTLNEGCGEPLNMEEVVTGTDTKRHMDLLVQMIVTIEHK